jgi:hypothetical protein
MGNIGSHVDISSGRRGHQGNIEAAGAPRSGNWNEGDFAPEIAARKIRAPQLLLERH